MNEEKISHGGNDAFKEKEVENMAPLYEGGSSPLCSTSDEDTDIFIKPIRCRCDSKTKIIRISLDFVVSFEKKTEHDRQDNVKANISAAPSSETPSITCNSISVNLNPDSSDDQNDEQDKMKGSTKEYFLPSAGKKQFLSPEGKHLVCRASVPCLSQTFAEIQKENKHSKSFDQRKRSAELEKQLNKLPILQDEIKVLKKEKDLLTELMPQGKVTLRSIGVGDCLLDEHRTEDLSGDDSRRLKNENFPDVRGSLTEGTLEELTEIQITDVSILRSDLAINDEPTFDTVISVCTQTDCAINEQNSHDFCENKKHKAADVCIDTSDLCTESSYNLSSNFPKWINKAPTYKSLIIKTRFRCPSIPDIARHLLNENDTRSNCSLQTAHSMSTQTSQEALKVNSESTADDHNSSSSSANSSVRSFRPKEDCAKKNALPFPSVSNEVSLQDDRSIMPDTKDRRCIGGGECKPRKEAVVRPFPRITESDEQLYSGALESSTRSSSISSEARSNSESEEFFSYARGHSNTIQYDFEERNAQLQSRSILFYSNADQLPELQFFVENQRNSTLVKLCDMCYRSLKHIMQNDDSYVGNSLHRTAGSCTLERQSVQQEVVNNYARDRRAFSEEIDPPLITRNERCSLQMDQLAVDRKECLTRGKSPLTPSMSNASHISGRVPFSNSWEVDQRSSLELSPSIQGRTVHSGLLRSVQVPQEEPDTADENQEAAMGDCSDLFANSLVKEEIADINYDSNDSRTFEIIRNCTSDSPVTAPGATVFKISDFEEGTTNLQCLLHADGRGQEEDKDTITEEFMNACQVINSHLMDLDKKRDNNLRDAVLLVQEKWFQIAGSKTSTSRTVRKYLQYFQSVSTEIVKWVVNWPDPDGYNTVLNFALANSNYEVVKDLLETGFCDLDKTNKAGHTAVIICASSRPQTEEAICTTKRIFRKGKINFRSLQRGQTALMIAVSHSNYTMVKLLLQAGADINAQDDDGSTALMFAAVRGDMECTKLLLNNPRCDTFIKDNNGANACRVALTAGHSTVGLLIYARTTEKTKVSTKLKQRRVNKI